MGALACRARGLLPSSRRRRARPRPRGRAPSARCRPTTRPLPPRLPGPARASAHAPAAPTSRSVCTRHQALGYRLITLLVSQGEAGTSRQAQGLSCHSERGRCVDTLSQQSRGDRSSDAPVGPTQTAPTVSCTSHAAAPRSPLAQAPAAPACKRRSLLGGGASAATAPAALSCPPRAPEPTPGASAHAAAEAAAALGAGEAAAAASRW
jgi:hypothetical protein